MIFRRINVGAPVSASPVIATMDSDSEPVISVCSSSVHLLRADGRAVAGWPRRGGGPFASTPAVCNRIAVGCDDDSLYLFDRSGRLCQGFPFRTGGDIYSSPSFLTIHGETHIVFGSDDGKIYLIDQRGAVRPGWPYDTGDYVSASPLATDLDGDGLPEIVCGSWDGRLYVLDTAGRCLPGWPRQLGHSIWSSPAVTDLDGDGKLEIVAAADSVYAFRLDGTPLDGFPVRTGSYMVSSPALADLDGDGHCEIWIGAEALYGIDRHGRVIYRGETGSYSWASPMIADVDGDGREEIVIGSWDGAVRSFKPGQAGRVLLKTRGPVFASAALGVTRLGGSIFAAASWDGGLYVAGLAHSTGRASWPGFRRGPSGVARGEPMGMSPYELEIQEIESPAAWFEPRGAELLFARVGQPTFVRVDGENPAGLRRGFLHYLHPAKRTWMRAPLVNDNGLCAIVQPFFDPCTVLFHAEGESWDGSCWRSPSSGERELRVDRPFHRARRALRRVAALAGS